MNEFPLHQTLFGVAADPESIMKIDFQRGDELEGCKWIARNYVLER